MAVYESSFSVSSAASDRRLASTADVEAVLGATAAGEITGLSTLLLQVSDLISAACYVPAGGVAVPTLKSETIAETFRVSNARSIGALPWPVSQPSNSYIFLSRFPVSSITSVVADGVTLSSLTDYQLRGAEGKLVRMSSDAEIAWSASKIVVTYVAGYSTVPEPLKLATIMATQEKASSVARDPTIRGESHEGLGSIQYFQLSASPAGLPAAVVDMIAPYRYSRL